MNSASKADRGDSTRKALIDAATRVFAQQGFDGASSRALAEAAGVNQALISYHFGGKEGLYLAVFEEMGNVVRKKLGPKVASVLIELSTIEALPVGRVSRSVKCMTKLLHTMVDVFLSVDTANWAKLMLREQQEPTEAFELVYNGSMRRMLTVLTRLVELATEKDAETDPRLTAFTLISQVMVFRLQTAAVTRFMEWDHGINESEIALIKKQIAQNVTARFRRED